MDGPALVDEGRVARDHEKPAQPGQRGYDVLADPVGKIFLLPVAAHVDERQDGNRRSLGLYQLGSRCSDPIGPFCDGIACRAAQLRVDRAHESKTLAWNRSNKLLVGAAVADRLACGVDAAGKRRIGNAASAPDLVDQIALADDPIAIFEQVYQEVEDLRLDTYSANAAAQLASIGIKYMIIKKKLHTQLCGSRETIKLI